MQTRRETALFRLFEADSAIAAHWLKTHHKIRDAPKITAKYQDAEDAENEEDEWLNPDDEDTALGSPSPFVDRLLNIAKEARLLVECKDIQDELGILTMVLRQQKGTLHEMERVFSEAPLTDDDKRFELSRKLSQQKGLVDLSLLDIERMDKQARAVNISLTQVLDLKQKHANALEVCPKTVFLLQVLTCSGSFHPRSSTRNSKARSDHHGLYHSHRHLPTYEFYSDLFRH